MVYLELLKRAAPCAADPSRGNWAYIVFEFPKRLDLLFRYMGANKSSIKGLVTYPVYISNGRFGHQVKTHSLLQAPRAHLGAQTLRESDGERDDPFFREVGGRPTNDGTEPKWERRQKG